MLRLLEGVVDVYLPDFKYADTGAGSLYSKVPDYPARARAALVEMFRQKGSRLEFDDEGLLKSGLLVRVLVLPNGAAGVSESLSWIAETLSPRVAISLMAQYYPIHRAATNEKYAALNRSISDREWERGPGGPGGERPLQRLPAGVRHGQPLLPSRLPGPGNAVSRHPGLPIAPDGATLGGTPGGEVIVCGPGSSPALFFPARPAARRR